MTLARNRSLFALLLSLSVSSFAAADDGSHVAPRPSHHECLLLRYGPEEPENAKHDDEGSSACLQELRGRSSSSSAELEDSGVVFGSQLSRTQFSSRPRMVNDIWGFVDGEGREYALVGLYNGTAVVDVTDAEKPVEVGTITGMSSAWRNMKALTVDPRPDSFRAYGYVTTEANQGYQIIDLSKVPASVTKVATYSGFKSAHTQLITRSPEGVPYAYICGSNLEKGGLRILDLTDPMKPVEVGSWEETYVHDIYVGNFWRDSAWDGRDVALAFCGIDGLAVIDLTDKTNPRTLAWLTYPGLRFCHSGWPSKNGRYLYIQDELDEGASTQVTTVYIADLTKLEAPEYVDAWKGTTAAIDHNGETIGDYYYFSSYTAGLLVLDVSDPDWPVLAASYDTHKGTDAPEFDGAWGMYAFLPSDKILISDMSKGLFVLRHPEKLSQFEPHGPKWTVR